MALAEGVGCDPFGRPIAEELLQVRPPPFRRTYGPVSPQFEIVEMSLGNV
jgi:hypothetical protein